MFKCKQRTAARLTSERAEHVSQLPAIFIKEHDTQAGCSLGALSNAMERSYSISARNEKEDCNPLSPALPTREENAPAVIR